MSRTTRFTDQIGTRLRSIPILLWNIIIPIIIVLFLGNRGLEAQQRATVGRSFQSLNPDISLDGLFSAGYFSEAEHLNFGGHDPTERGFTAQNIEMSLTGAVDPYFQGEAHVIFGLSRGESFLEMEEVFFTSLALPLNLQLRGGQFFTRFGRLNPTHPHTWDFADLPIINSRLFGGDGLRQVGMQLSYLLPLPIYTELILSMQNPHGETAVSFFNTASEGGEGHGHAHAAPSAFVQEPEDEDHHEDEEENHHEVEDGHHEGDGHDETDQDDHEAEDHHDADETDRDADEEGATYLGRPLIDREVDSLADFIYMTRLQSSVDFTDTLTMVWGGSALFGPNASGKERRTTILGTDLYFKWRPLSNVRGWPFVAWQTEVMWRNYEADRFVDADGEVIPEADLKDSGFYSQLLYGFHPRWVAGIRGEYTNGEDSTDPMQDGRYRLSANLTFYPSEFSKWRLQYNYDVSESKDDDPIHAVFLQWEFLMGAHAAHQF